MATVVYPKQQPAEEQIEDSPKSPLKAFLKKYEKYTGIAIFGLGFIWDSLTMTRVDNLLDNLILLSYLIVIGAMIVFTLRRQCGHEPARLIRKVEPRFLWVMQFCFGGLFSSYVIFYFKSASFTRTQFFFLILVVLWIGNEFLEQRLKNQALLAVLYCFCMFSFLAFFLPVLLARIDALIFVLAGVVSVAASLVVFSLGLLPKRDQWRRSMLPATGWILSTFAAVIILYFANLIPPVPLALKTARIYHYARKTASGYEVKYVPPPLFRFWREWDDPFFHSPGERVYCYTAVFAPARLRSFPVYHVWSRKTAKGWLQTDRIPIRILEGGRAGGYRGYSDKGGIWQGEWRVEVETERGQTLGRIDFTVVASPADRPALATGLI